MSSYLHIVFMDLTRLEHNKCDTSPTGHIPYVLYTYVQHKERSRWLTRAKIRYICRLFPRSIRNYYFGLPTHRYHQILRHSAFNNAFSFICRLQGFSPRFPHHGNHMALHCTVLKCIKNSLFKL